MRGSFPSTTDTQSNLQTIARNFLHSMTRQELFSSSRVKMPSFLTSISVRTLLCLCVSLPFHCRTDFLQQSFASLCRTVHTYRYTHCLQTLHHCIVCHESSWTTKQRYHPVQMATTMVSFFLFGITLAQEFRLVVCLSCVIH